MRRNRHRKSGGGLVLAAACAALACVGIAAPAAAGSFQVNPVNLTLPADRQSTSLTIRNNDSAPVAVRVETFGWSQQEGRDVYSATTDVIVSPAIFTIAPGATQLIRVGLRARSAKAYRVIFAEIPRRQSTDSIQVALRLNLPLYLASAAGAKPALSWTLRRSPSGDMVVEGRNAGAVQAQVLGLEVEDGEGRRTILSQDMGVILPASTRDWKTGAHPELRTGSSLLLRVRNSVGVTQSKIVVEQR
jgi:fimbrial chaperone protein